MTIPVHQLMAHVDMVYLARVQTLVYDILKSLTEQLATHLSQATIKVVASVLDPISIASDTLVVHVEQREHQVDKRRQMKTART